MSRRIVHVCRSAPPRIGGLEASVLGLMRAQQARGARVSIVSLRDPEVEVLPPPKGIEIVRLPRLGSRRYPFALGLLPALDGADVVHVHGIDGLLDQITGHLSRYRPRPFSVGVSTHGAYFHTDRNPWLKALAVRTLTARALRRVDAVWFTSDNDRQRLAAAGVSGAVLPNGIDLQRLSGITRRPERGVLLSVGRIDVHKGLELLIDGLGEARHLRPEIALRIAGPEQVPGLVSALQQRAELRKVSDRVCFLGPLGTERLREELARAERAVFPSRYEGQGMALIEAMAAGVPVIASDIEAFRVHGDHIDTLSFHRPDRLARALQSPVDPERVARAAHHAASFGWEVRAEAFDAAYAEMAS